MSQEASGTVADAVRGSWVDVWAPSWARPYLRLARLDRPIGTWLLLLPCWWSIALAAVASGGYPDPWLIGLFGIGAVVMRGAGCTYNDIVDRDFDNRVARTRSRPIPSGQVSVVQAWAFAVGLSLVGLLVLLQFNWFAIGVGVASLGIVAIYPFMKRVTWWPQFFLGLAFNWGALLGWAAVLGRLDWAAAVLYVAGIFWTLGYDTIYAHQDKEDDALIGVKSTARLLGPATTPWLAGFFVMTTAFLTLAGHLAGAGWVFYAGLGLSALHLVWQIATLDIDDPDRCLKLFRANRDYGLIVFAAIAADALSAGLL
ncbi:MAG TPA: 4-hydroxybenzoate octaprenyltransferase [Hyphomicrobiales bacterium]|nr:4-hydroxybenzoate octaprenyltransferase [Hyphomicrobiales bacterium]